jgi:hypothetical protein
LEKIYQMFDIENFEKRKKRKTMPLFELLALFE